MFTYENTHCKLGCLKLLRRQISDNNWFTVWMFMTSILLYLFIQFKLTTFVYPFILLIHLSLSTVECHYNMVLCNMIFHTALESLQTKVFTHKRHPIFYHKKWAMGVYCEDLRENWPHYNGTALYLYLMCQVLLAIIYLELPSNKSFILLNDFVWNLDNSTSFVQIWQLSFLENYLWGLDHQVE